MEGQMKLLTLILITLLAACGGGGNDSPAVAPVPTPAPTPAPDPVPAPGTIIIVPVTQPPLPPSPPVIVPVPIANILEFLYTVNPATHTISAYKINPLTGALTQLPGSPFPSLPGLTTISVDASHQRITAYDSGSSATSYTINQLNGGLTPISYQVGPPPPQIVSAYCNGGVQHRSATFAIEVTDKFRYSASPNGIAMNAYVWQYVIRSCNIVLGALLSITPAAPATEFLVVSLNY
jgi:hypothetical protein